MSPSIKWEENWTNGCVSKTLNLTVTYISPFDIFYATYQKKADEDLTLMQGHGPLITKLLITITLFNLFHKNNKL